MCPSIVHSHDRNGLSQLVSITERSFLKQERRQCLRFGWGLWGVWSYFILIIENGGMHELIGTRAAGAKTPLTYAGLPRLTVFHTAGSTDVTN